MLPGYLLRSRCCRLASLLAVKANGFRSNTSVVANPRQMGRRFYATRFGYALARSLIFSKYGPPDQVLNPPYDDQITVKFLASPINPADINQIEGLYPAKPEFTKSLGTPEDNAVPGNEGLVQIVSCGSKVDPAIRPGQWAIMAGPKFGTWRTYAAAKQADLIVIPDRNGLSPIQVATVSVNPATAYRMLRDFGDMHKGDFFVQNGANSGVGRSAIQFGRIWGFKSINIVRDRSDIQDLKSELMALGATEVLTEEEAKDKSRIAEITGGKPIKLALNCVCGQSATNLTKILGNGGHLVTYGAMAKKPLTLPASVLIFKDIHCHGFWVSAWSDKNPGAKSEMIQEILDLIRTGEFKDLPYEPTIWTDETDVETLLKAVMKGITEYSTSKGVFVMEGT